MTYTNRDDEFDGTEYDNEISDLRDELRGLNQDLCSERAERERLEERIQELLDERLGTEEHVHYVEDQLDSALRLLDDILEDVSYEIQAHNRGSRTPEEAWDLLRDIAARIREVV